MSMLRSIVPAIVLMGVICVPARLQAQAVYGSVVGTVTDASGAAIPNAKVTIRDMDRDVSNVAHNQRVGQLHPALSHRGRYQVRVEASGFQTSVQDNVTVSVDAETKIDAKLSVGPDTNCRSERRGVASENRTQRRFHYLQPESVSGTADAEPAVHQLPVDDARSCRSGPSV